MVKGPCLATNKIPFYKSGHSLSKECFQNVVPNVVPSLYRESLKNYIYDLVHKI